MELICLEQGNRIVPFSTGIVTQITGISHDRLTYWHWKDLLVPSIGGPEVHAPRRGVPGRRPGAIGRQYSFDDIVLALVIRELFAAGVSLDRIRRAVGALRDTFSDRPLYPALRGSEFRLVVLRSGEARVVPADAVCELSGRYPKALVALARVVRTAEELLADWQRRRLRRVQDRRSLRGLVVVARLGGPRLQTAGASALDVPPRVPDRQARPLPWRNGAPAGELAMTAAAPVADAPHHFRAQP